MRRTSAVFLLAAALIFCAAVNAAPSSHSSSSSSTVNANGSTTIFPNLMWMTWNVTQASPSAAMTVLLDMIVAGDYSGQIGFLTGTGMQGYAIACYMAPASSSGICVDIDGYNWDIDRRAANSVATLLSTTRTGGRTIFHMQLASLPISTIGDKSTPMFFAYSGWDTPASLPLEHPGHGTNAFALNFATGAQSAVARRPLPVNVPALIGALFAIWFGVMVLCNWCGVVLSRRGYLITLTVTAIFFCIFIAVVIFAAWRDYDSALAASPVFRAFGDGTAFMFGLVLFPVSRWLGIGRLARISYDRFVQYHVVVGLLLFVFMLIHFAGMWADYGMAKMTKNTGDIPVLPGLLSFIFLSALLVPSLLRRQAYSLFKYTHVLVLAVIITGILHYKRLIFYLLPGGILYILDWLIRWIRTFHARATLVHMAYHPEAGVTTVQLRVARRYTGAPGQYVSLRVLRLSPLPHPMSIALVADNVMTLYIKNNGGSTWTSRLAMLAQRIAAEGGNVGALHVDIDGPTGMLSVPLDRCPVVVLVAGGIGITPMLSILQAMATHPHACHAALSHVVLVWSVRSRGLAQLLWRDIAALEHAFRTRHPHTRLTIHIHATGTSTGNGAAASVQRKSVGGEPADRHGSMEALHVDEESVIDGHRGNGRDIPMLPVAAGLGETSIVPFVVGRPDVKKIVAEAAAVDRTAVYACGPDSLLGAVRNACGPHKNVLLHTETFEF